MGKAPTTARLSLRDEPGATRKLRGAICEAATASRLPEDARFELLLAATEAFTNAIKGASGPQSVDVQIKACDEGVEVVITDRGRFAPQTLAEGPLEGEGGRGIPLMVALVDEVEFTSV